jgi:hypothetical protein
MKTQKILVALLSINLFSCAVRQNLNKDDSFRNPEIIKIQQAFKNELNADDIRFDSLVVIKPNSEYRTVFTPNPGLFSKNVKYKANITCYSYSKDTSCFLYVGDNKNRYFMIGKPKKSDGRFDSKLFLLKIYKVDSLFTFEKSKVKFFELQEPIKSTLKHKIYENENNSPLEWELNGFFNAVTYISNETIDLFQQRNEVEIIRRFSKNKPIKKADLQEE